MTKHLTLLLFIGLAWGQNKTIAILDFDGDGISQSETRTLTNRLRDEIFNTGSYIVLERGKMDEVLEEQGFQQTGCVTSECAVEVGNMLGVQQMIGGSIGKVGNIYTVSARIIDVQSGKILKSANYDHIGEIGQLLLKGMKEVVIQLTSDKVSDRKELSSVNNNSKKIITPSPKSITSIQLQNILELSKIKSISDTELNTLCLRFYDKSVMNLSFLEAEELIQGIVNDMFTSSKPDKKKDVVLGGNTSNRNKLFGNCLIALISLYVLGFQ